MEDDIISFNKIYLIQSLQNGEMKTGVEIHDTIRYSSKFEEEFCDLINVHSSQDLLKALNAIKEKAQEGELPYIHIECHGYTEGITLSSGERISYQALADQISQINLATGNNLFISIAACRGAKFQFIMDIGKPCPFRGFIGPDCEPTASDLRDAYVLFFRHLLISKGFEEPISIVQGQYPQLNMNTFSAEHFFDLIWKLQIEEKYNKNTHYQKMLEKVIKIHWSRREVKKLYRTYSHFKKRMKKITRKWNIEDMKIELRNRFLHIQ